MLLSLLSMVVLKLYFMSILTHLTYIQVYIELAVVPSLNYITTSSVDRWHAY